MMIVDLMTRDVSANVALLIRLQCHKFIVIKWLIAFHNNLLMLLSLFLKRFLQNALVVMNPPLKVLLDWIHSILHMHLMNDGRWIAARSIYHFIISISCCSCGISLSAWINAFADRVCSLDLLRHLIILTTVVCRVLTHDRVDLSLRRILVELMLWYGIGCSVLLLLLKLWWVILLVDIDWWRLFLRLLLTGTTNLSAHGLC
jgi:hypothetical protein